MTDQHDAAPPPREPIDAITAVQVHLRIAALETALARVTAERDAAVRELTELRRIVALHRDRALTELAAIDADQIDTARPAP